MSTAVAKKTIRIPSCENHAGMSSHTIEVEWKCLVCGADRGETKKGSSYDGSRRMDGVDMWENPCGHTETYSMVNNHYWQGINTELTNRFIDELTASLIEKYGADAFSKIFVCKEDQTESTLHDGLIGVREHLGTNFNALPLNIESDKNELLLKIMNAIESKYALKAA